MFAILSSRGPGSTAGPWDDRFCYPPSLPLGQTRSLCTGLWYFYLFYERREAWVLLLSGRGPLRSGLECLSHGVRTQRQPPLGAGLQSLTL